MQDGFLSLRAFRGLAALLPLSLSLGLASIAPAHAQVNESILHTFNAYGDGANPYGSLIQGKDGAYYGTTEYGGTNGDGTIFKIDSTGLTTIHSFTGPDGYYPLGSLIQGSDGTLYGTTQNSWSYYGEVYKVNPDGTGFTVLHSFNPNTDGYYPQSGVILGKDGMLYGTSIYGGPNGYGTVFQVSTDGTVFNVVHSFNSSTDGYYPYAGVIQGSDGKLYGTAYYGGPNSYGTVFQVSTDGSTFNVVHSFTPSTDGYYPYAGVIQGSDGKLYGTTQYGGPNSYGTVFQVSTDGTVFNVVHGFNYYDGYYPYAGVIQASDGKLYGTTEYGGSNGNGTVFQVSTDGTVFNTLHSFDPSTEGYDPIGGVTQGSDGLLHGTSYYGPQNQPRNIGTIYTVDTAGTTFNTVYQFNNGVVDGRNPGYGTLVKDKAGNLYGTTIYGGVNGDGTLFKITPAGKMTTLHLFANNGDGYYPYSDIVFDSKGNIYGTTAYGGYNGGGTVYEYSPATKTFTTLYSFSGSGGYYLPGGLVISGTSLYGTTYQGGQSNQGIVFRINLATAKTPLTFHILHSFSGGSDGANPFGTLILGSDKNLYGTTVFGGGNGGYGTVYKISPGSAVLTILHSFNYSDGYQPYGTLLQGHDGLLYGTTAYGGANYDGTVFQISKDGLTFNTIHSFNNADGYYPLGALTQATDGNLYGTTQYGGANGNGTVFQISTDGTVFNTVHNFSNSGTDGYNPYAGLVEGLDGNLYGTTYQGGINPGFNTDIQGTLYSLQTHLPIISAVSPNSGSATAGTTIGITGVNLTGATVTIHGVAQTVQAGATATALKFKLNSATPTGSWPVIVTTANGQGISPKNFTVNP